MSLENKVPNAVAKVEDCRDGRELLRIVNLRENEHVDSVVVDVHCQPNVETEMSMRLVSEERKSGRNMWKS